MELECEICGSELAVTLADATPMCATCRERLKPRAGMNDRERRLEIAAKNPEQVAESLDERLQRDKMRWAFENANRSLNLAASYYEAGWKAAKAYFNVQAESEVISN